MKTSLVDTDWVAKHIDDPNVRLIEIDWDGLSNYNSEHISGAIGWNWKTALWDPFKREFPTKSEFANRLGAAGINRDTTVVFYGAPVQFGTYAWWVFKYLGHLDVRMLDGGLTKWKEEGRAVLKSVPIITPQVYVPNDRNEMLRAGRDNVLSEISNANSHILDHRSIEEYLGNLVGLPGKPDVGAERYGRIPNALHIPFDSLINADTTFKSRKELHEIFAGKIKNLDQKIISYCRLAHRATLASFVMTEILGYENVRVYDGSWTEWGSIVGFPIER